MMKKANVEIFFFLFTHSEIGSSLVNFTLTREMPHGQLFKIQSWRNGGTHS